MQWTIDHILSATAGRLLYGRLQTSFAGIGIDSRAIAHDHFFVAIRGDRHDGHSFLRQVIAKGIYGVLIEESAADSIDHTAMQAAGAACIAVPETIRALGDLARFQRRQMDIPVVAITGSNGKTTTRRMAAAVAATRFNILATHGNLNNEIGVPLTLFDLARSHQAAVLELGMNHPGEIDRLGAICLPTIGLITNVGPAHLEFLGSLAGVALSKAELIGHIDEHGSLILNGDDPLVAEMARKAGHRRVIFFGVNEKAHVRADAIRDAGQGTAFDLLIADQGAGIRLPARGRFMVSNALAAAAAGMALGIGIEEIKAALEAYRPLQGRMAITRFADGSAVIDDTYNANPASMQAAIEALASLKADQPGVIVVGDMLELGGEAAGLHHSLGRQAAAGGVLRLYACGRHAEDVARGAVEAGMNAAMIVIGTKEEITGEVIRHLSSGTWVLVKGSRGMAMESIVRALIDHFQNQ